MSIFTVHIQLVYMMYRITVEPQCCWSTCSCEIWLQFAGVEGFYLLNLAVFVPQVYSLYSSIFVCLLRRRGRKGSVVGVGFRWLHLCPSLLPASVLQPVVVDLGHFWTTDNVCIIDYMLFEQGRSRA